MKKIVLGMAMLMAAGSTFAANSHSKGAMSLGFDTAFKRPFTSQDATTTGGDLITGKYMMSSNVAITAGLAFANYGGDATGSDTVIALGARNYMSRGDYSPFVGGHFATFSYQDGNISGIEFAAEAGAEYFIDKQFSFEGTAMFGYSSVDDKTGGATVTTTRFGTSRASIGFNFYF